MKMDRKRRNVVGIAGLSLIGIVCIGLLIILVLSPGRLEPLKDSGGKRIEGAIAEKVWIEVNGIKQGMFIRGENMQNPVILYLHGGPGTPMLQFIEYMEKMQKQDVRLEKYFTICYWDQRGAGMTYSGSTEPSTMTVDQMVEDTRVVTEYLKSRFSQDKIYLLGHSWGSYLGIKVIEKYPQNYPAYIGIGQVTNQTESERLAYTYMLDHAKEIGDTDSIEKLERFDPHGDSFPNFDYLVIGRTAILNKYGVGHLHRGVTFKEIFKTVFVFKGYTIGEKINWFRGADFSMIHLFPQILKDSLFESSAHFDIPVYIIQGTYDYMTSQVLAKKYAEVLEAPKKEIFEFTASAHSPNMEEPEKFIEVFCKIASENPL